MLGFEEYVAARGPALVRLARLLVNDPHRAEDLAQETLARAFVRWRRIAETEQPDLYVRQMLVNANRSWWRRRSNRELPVADGPVEPSPRDPASETADRDHLWRLLQGLTRRQREVLVLRYYEDLDDQTIALILDCSPVTVRTHAMRGVAALRGRLVDTAPGSQA